MRWDSTGLQYIYYLDTKKLSDSSATYLIYVQDPALVPNPVNSDKIGNSVGIMPK